MDDNLDLTEEDLAAPYVPTPDEIVAGCAAVQTAWDDDERIRRARWAEAPASIATPTRRGRRRESSVGRD